MYCNDKGIERTRPNKFLVNEPMNTFYINKKVLENQEYMKTQKNFMKGRDLLKNKKQGMTNMMMLNNSFHYDQTVGISLNTKSSMDSIGMMKGSFPHSQAYQQQ